MHLYDDKAVVKMLRPECTNSEMICWKNINIAWENSAYLFITLILEDKDGAFPREKPCYVAFIMM